MIGWFFLGYVVAVAVFLAAWAATVPCDCECEDDEFERLLSPWGYRRLRSVEDRRPYDWAKDGL